MRRGGKALGTTESTIEATKNSNPSGPLGGRSQTQPRQVRRVHRRKLFLRRERGAQAPVSEGRGVQALARPTHEQSQPRTNTRRRSYKNRIANMKPRPIQFGVRENTASSRQHAPRLAEDKQSCDPVLPTIEAFNLSHSELGQGATGREKEGSNNSASESHAKDERSRTERPLTCEEAAELVRVHPKTVKRMARSGELPGHFRFGRWFFYSSELDSWMRTELHSSRHSCR